MVKGISRQVIVVHAPDPQLFEQAIFILKDDAVGRNGVTEELLLKEARRIVAGSGKGGKKRRVVAGPLWACAGAVVTGIVWLVTMLL